MREQDKQTLGKPYVPAPSGYPEAEFAQAIGVQVENVHLLMDEIFSDLDAAAGGIGWWNPGPGKTRRILISDYLYQCLDGILDNLVDARLHLFELRDVLDQEAASLVDAIQLKQTAPGTWKIAEISLPRPTSPLDSLANRLFSLHVAGFLRAACAVLDCLGAAIIGVAGLKSDLVRADFGSAQRALGQLRAQKAPSEAERIQIAIGDAVQRLLDAAGPRAWADWMTKLRNVFIHRGRRLDAVSVIPQTTGLFRPDGTPIVRAVPVIMLPRDPDRTEIESFLDSNPGSPNPTLDEAAEATLDGVFASLLTFTNNTAGALNRMWGLRRMHPQLIVQPAEQWRVRQNADTASGFVGYAPGSVPGTATSLTLHPDRVRRLDAAWLLNGRHAHWSTFD